MIAGPFIVIGLTISKHNTFIFVGFLAYLLVTRSIKGIMYFAYGNPRPPFWWILYMPHFIIFQYFSAVFRIWALFTLRNRKWGNRNVKVSNKTGEIVRTDANGKRIIKKDIDDIDDIEMQMQIDEIDKTIELVIIDDDKEEYSIEFKDREVKDHGSSSIEKANDDLWLPGN